jgi:hypothetical protein
MKPLKSFIIWILLLALPMQGFAAASMVACSHMAAPAVQALAHDAGEHCQNDAKASKNDCSVHADCRLAAAIVLTFTCLVTQHPAGSQQIAYTGVYATSHVPDGLERPPHSAV